MAGGSVLDLGADGLDLRRTLPPGVTIRAKVSATDPSFRLLARDETWPLLVEISREASGAGHIAIRQNVPDPTVTGCVTNA